jgi:hypothetical protein
VVSESPELVDKAAGVRGGVVAAGEPIGTEVLVDSVGRERGRS